MKNDKFWWMVGVFMMSALFAFSLPADGLLEHTITCLNGAQQ